MDMGPMGVYRIFDEGKGSPMGDGGMMTKTPEIPNSRWGFYFQVDAIDAAIERVNAGMAARSFKARIRFPAAAGSSRG